MRMCMCACVRVCVCACGTGDDKNALRAFFHRRLQTDGHGHTDDNNCYTAGLHVCVKFGNGVRVGKLKIKGDMSLAMKLGKLAQPAKAAL